MKRVGLAIALVLGLLPSAFAQYAGNVYGTVTDESGAILPGAIVKLTSPLGSRETTTGTQGDFRFLNLDSGDYTIAVSLAGFTNVTRQVSVTSGQNVNLTFPLKVASVEETVTVTAETPIVDTKKVGTSTTLTKEELAQVPNARDPWAILRTVPGIIQDRVNIGGNENGQQASFVGKGDDGDNTMWNLDGVVVTDTGATGASPTYYDFDAFEEISVTTGGNDVRVQTGGIGINFQTRRGTNQVRGSVHGFLTHDDLQSNNLPAELASHTLPFGGADNRMRLRDGTFAEKGDHIQQIADYGGELGGPIVKDKLWFYGSWGRQDIRLVRINQTADKTKLTSYNAKLNWQAGSNDMVSLFYFNGEKTKEGRLVGFGITEEDTFLWNQGGVYNGGPHGFMKAEWNHTFSPNFFLSTKVSRYNTGFFLSPRGGDINGTVNFDTGVASGAYLDAQIRRPAHTANVDANYFRTGMGGNHEFKFGFGYRRAEIQSTTHWGGNQLFSYISGGGGYTHVSRDSKTATYADYWSGYLGDTFTKNRLTLNVGVRYDRQINGNNPYLLPANKSFPDILGAIDFDGNTPEIKWSDISPRVGLTLALDEARKTVVRASYARYASQLPSGTASFLAPSQSPGSYFAYIWEDTSGDGFAQPNEVRTDLGVQYTGYVNANDPNGPSSNRLDPDYHSQKDNEFVVGLERELAGNLALSLAYTYRRGDDIFGWQPRLGLTTADYTPRNFSRFGYTAVGYVPNSAKVEATGAGRLLTNRPDYHRTFGGFEASLLKRLSNRWMARLAFTYNDAKEHYDGPGAIQNPTRTDTDHGTSMAGPQADGGQYAPRSTGSGKGDTIIGAKWQVVANTLLQLPAGLELSGALFGRQGHPFAVIFRPSLGDEGLIRVLATEIPELDTQRYDNVWNLDLRLAKNFRIGGSSFTLSADAFNVFNNDVILGRLRQASSGSFNRIDEVLNPRIIRFGMRFQF